MGLQTIRATAWPIPDASGWHWCVSVAEPGHSLSGPASACTEPTLEAALDEAVRQGRRMLETPWHGTAGAAA